MATTPPLPTVSKCGTQCHWLRTRPHNNGTDKSTKAGLSVEWGNASHTRNHQGHTHWDHEVHARPPTNANQTESGAGQSRYFRAIKNPHNPLQAEDSTLQVCQLTELKQTKEWERYPNQFRHLCDLVWDSCQEYEKTNWENTVKNGQRAKLSQRSGFSFKKTANRRISYTKYLRPQTSCSCRWY